MPLLSPSARAALPYALTYAGLFGTIGLYLPYFPVWLQARGFGAEEIALVIALPAWLRIVTTPALAGFADSSGRPRRIMLLLALGTLACFLGLSVAGSLLLVALLHGLGALLHQPQMPINESLTVQASKGGAFDYGRARLWGSLAFILANLGGGWLLTGRSADVVLWAIAGMMAATAVVVLVLPGTLPGTGASRQAGAPRRWQLPWTLLAERRFLTFCVLGALVQGSHGFYYAFGSLNWLAQGLNETWIGWLWATGVVGEVLLFWQGGRLARRLGAFRLMALGLVGGLLRWPLMALLQDPWLLLPVQGLHALTFAAYHLGAMRHIADTVAPERAATSQALYATITGSLGIGTVMFLSGPLYQHLGGAGYYAMALLAAAALLPLRRLARPGGAQAAD